LFFTNISGGWRATHGVKRLVVDVKTNRGDESRKLCCTTDGPLSINNDSDS